MTSYARKAIVSVFVGAAFVTAAASPAQAANQNQAGLINVAVGDVAILNDANIGVAAQVAAALCGIKVGPVAVLGVALDGSGDMTTVCTTEQGPVTITQS